MLRIEGLIQRHLGGIYTFMRHTYTFYRGEYHSFYYRLRLKESPLHSAHSFTSSLNSDAPLANGPFGSV
ncbi:unnamed protein product [Meloidogyne enterolobii]|uniref:Uncharacterized protein n=1 Tax=Meloidogyne enterolobii TaxID=390850 RepID=A0ACB0Z9P2_MELEN